MDCEFGDIIDYRGVSSVDHFRLVLGVDEIGNKIIYETITSRFYRAFEKLCSFFNDYCIDDKCPKKHFAHYFKDKSAITSVNLSDVFFIDKKIYSGCLTNDSMIIINREPATEDISAFDNLHKNKLINFANRLSKEDMIRLYAYIKTSKHISPYYLNWIGKSFNIVNKGKIK